MINNIISEVTSIKGEITLEGILRIEGSFEGLIINKGKIYISKSGKVHATLRCEQLIIGGLFYGDIFCKGNTRLLETATVKGKIYTKSITADKGSYFDGDCILI